MKVIRSSIIIDPSRKYLVLTKQRLGAKTENILRSRLNRLNFISKKKQVYRDQ